MDPLFQERNPQMPPLGSRVKRGRDWRYENQDDYGPGTVIGHSKRGKFCTIHCLYNVLNRLSYIFIIKRKCSPKEKNMALFTKSENESWVKYTVES